MPKSYTPKRIARWLLRQTHPDLHNRQCANSIIFVELITRERWKAPVNMHLNPTAHLHFSSSTGPSGAAAPTRSRSLYAAAQTGQHSSKYHAIWPPFKLALTFKLPTNCPIRKKKMNRLIKTNKRKPVQATRGTAGSGLVQLRNLCTNHPDLH